MEATRQQVLAFRLHQQHLSTRLPATDLLKAAGACAVQNTPPGSAAQALHARVEGLSPEAVTRALEDDKNLLQSWSLRAAPHLFPLADAPYFTAGLLPPVEESLRAFIFGVQPALDKIGLTALDALEHTCQALLLVLDGREMTKDELGVELAAHIAPQLSSSQRNGWAEPSMYAAGQSLGESVVRFFLPVTSLRGLCCHAGRRGGKAFLALTGQWLGRPLPQVADGDARAGLVRRYLHALGPSTVGHFAAWAGISPQQARLAWQAVEPELRRVEYGTHPTWLLDPDDSELLSAALPSGVRLLPPGDPFLSLRDRGTLIENEKMQRLVWRTSGNPGVVLVNGEAAGLWRPEKRGSRLTLKVQAFVPLPAPARSAIEAEAAALAPFRDAAHAVVEFSTLTEKNKPGGLPGLDLTL